MKLSQILPDFKATERAFFMGTSGSGKTTLARLIVSIPPRMLVLDTKHDLNWRGFEKIYDLKKVFNSKADRIIYRPERGFERDAKYTIQTQLFEWIWFYKNRGVYIDEATQISTSTRICPSLFDLITRGRSKGIPVYAGSQRPSGVKQEFLSEAQNIYCFNLNLPADKKKAYEFGNIDVDLIQQKHDGMSGANHYFIYSKNGKTTKPIILT